MNKRGIEGGGFSIIIAIIILLISGAVVLAVLMNVAPKADEKTQIDVCRVSNEIRYNIVEEGSKGLVSSPRICSTIDKTGGLLAGAVSAIIPVKEEQKQELGFTRKIKSNAINKISGLAVAGGRVPTKTYPQNEAGAEAEIRDMIKNCWYMWLEGSVHNMFQKMPFGNGCFMCYRFKVNQDLCETSPCVDFASLKTSMQQPYFAVSDKDYNCDPPRGGKWVDRSECTDTDQKIVKTEESRVCCRKDIRFECENKGGKCLSKGATDSTYNAKYLGWACPTSEQTCHIKGENSFSYVKYITEFGARGGDIFFVPPGEYSCTANVREGDPIAEDDSICTSKGDSSVNIANLKYDMDEQFAISFVSPSRQFCASGGGDTQCWLGVGLYGAIGTITVGTGIALVGPGVAGSFAVGMGMRGVLLGTIASKIKEIPLVGSIFGLFGRKVSELATRAIAKEVPNFIVVSTFEHAQNIGCAMN